MIKEEEQIAKAKELLRAAGFRLSVLGCGCCGSPEVRLEHNGITIIGEGDVPVNECNFDMFEEESEGDFK